MGKREKGKGMVLLELANQKHPVFLSHFFPFPFFLLTLPFFLVQIQVTSLGESVIFFVFSLFRVFVIK
jgi:hypothetical protein